MEKYSLVYIDDNPETALSRYLDEEFKSDNYEIVYSEIIFNPEDGYESLLSDQTVSSANIILIDSWLFENRTAANVKFAGEEFKLILKKLFEKSQNTINRSANLLQNTMLPNFQKSSIKRWMIFNNIGYWLI